MADNIVVILCIVLIVLIILGYIAFIYNKEEGFSGQLIANETRFLKGQESIFWKNTNKVLTTNNLLANDFKSVNGAFVINDTFGNNKNSKTDVSHYFETDIIPGFERQNQSCAEATEPRLLPARDNKYSGGCGWWYVNDVDKPSVGSRGTNLGPFKSDDLDKSHKGGKWIWDLQAAQKMEDEKRCRKIKSCDMADLVPGRCGYCIGTMKGVPVDGNGQVLYPTDMNLNCETRPITKHSNCPRPPAPEQKPGAQPGPPGSPPGSSLPLPKPQLCDPNPGSGKLSNECLIELAKGTGCNSDGAIINILSGDSNGYFSQPGANHEKFLSAVSIIKDGTALQSPDEFFGFGTCTRSEALGYYNSIVKTAAAGSNSQIRAAAGFLATGADFNECLIDDNTPGPFTLHCLETLARESGCQADGTDFPAEDLRKQARNIPKFCGKFGRPSSDGNIRLYNKSECDKLEEGGNHYPNGECTKKAGGSYSWDCRELNMAEAATSSTKDKYDRMDWGSVVKHFRDLYNNMHSSNASMIVSATKKCLGVDITLPEEDCGDVMGVYYYCYRWEYYWNLPSGGVPKSLYLGRFTKDKMIEISNNGKYVPFNVGTDRIHLRLKGKFKQASGSAVTRMWVQTDDGVAVRMNGQPVLQKWSDQGPTAYETPSFVLSQGKDVSYEIDWYNNYGGYVLISRLFLNNSFIPPPSQMLKLNQPSGYPFARWDFYEGSVEDRCGNLNAEVVGSVPVSNVDGKKCMVFAGQNYMRITNGLMMASVRSISMMVYIRSNHSGWPRLWEFNNTPLGAFNQGNGGWCADSLFGCASPNNSMGFGFYAKKGCAGPDKWSGNGTVEVGKWYHIVWTLDDALDTMTMWINGVKSFSNGGAAAIINKDKVYQNLYIVNSVEYFDKNIAVAWFRMFDYTLTEKDVNIDRMNKFSTSSLFPTSNNSGW